MSLATRTILDLPDPEIEGVLARSLQRMGQPPYRTDQVLHWIFRRRVLDPARMSNLPPDLRERLARDLPPGSLREVARADSGDGTRKYLWGRPDGSTFESVRIPTARRTTLCVSSQVGCALGCDFCATGAMGFRADLTKGEIVEQVLRMLEGEPDLASVNVVFMGMGEPLLNRGAVFEAIEALNSRAEIGARRITVSTVGVVPGMDALAEFPLQVRLAVSLHAATDEVRSRLVPINRKWPLASLMEACRRYHRRTGRRISFEYTLLPGVNDLPGTAEALRELLGDLPAKLNLIPYNRIEGAAYRPPTAGEMDRFARDLRARLVQGVSVRRNRGNDVTAACGQLRTRVERRPAVV